MGTMSRWPHAYPYVALEVLALFVAAHDRSTGWPQGLAPYLADLEARDLLTADEVLAITAAEPPVALEIVEGARRRYAELVVARDEAGDAKPLGF
jgi:hypothetical protein